MAAFPSSICQYFAPPTTSALDTALLRLFPEIPDRARRILRQPLKRWYSGAMKFLKSPQERTDDLLFAAVCISLPALYAAQRRPYIATLFQGIRSYMDAVLARIPPCCHCRYTLALLCVLDLLFGDEDRQPSEDTNSPCGSCDPIVERK
jgi:hypothetical protein